MKADFRKRVKDALNNRHLQTALDRNAESRMHAWEQTFETLPGAEQLRRIAHHIRLDTLNHLDHYLERFREQLEVNGVQVHQASDAAQACEIVLKIAQRHDASLVTKSKSMVTEEIGLNHALNRAGMRVVETDLGEYIVQLRGEPPAHIITPAVHLRREDVAQTLSTKLGIPYTTNIADLTAAVRKILREDFLQAHIGISGVNFGVVENGLLCLLTNEGNGRMVTSLPAVHIAVMGIERLVPSMDDLGVMLKLLPRSATGQKLTSYVSLIRQPRMEGDPDGPTERHVILVENGRRALAQGNLREALLCIRCGACLNVCPVFREIGGHSYATIYPGPIGSIISPALFGMRSYGHLALASTLCGACEQVCPVQIDLPTLLLRTRHHYRAEAHPHQMSQWAMEFYAWVMTSPRRYRTAQRLMAWFTSLLPRKQGWLRTLPPPFSTWTKTRHFPRFALKTFRDRFVGMIAGASKDPQAMDHERETDAIGDTSPLEDNVARLREEIENLGGRFLRCEARRMAEIVAQEMTNLGVRSVMTWGGEAFFSSKILQRLRDLGMEVFDREDLSERYEQRTVQLRRLARVEAGLTGAASAIAESGTLVVASGPGQPQVASLLPAIHMILLSRRSIRRSLEEWLQQDAQEIVASSSCVTLISGPSRTADIEMTLTVGVHGPGTLIVICYDDEGSA